MTPQAVLAQKLTLPNGVIIKNRLLKSAMSEALGARDGASTPELTRLYQAWADGGIGLCVTGNVMIDHAALAQEQPFPFRQPLGAVVKLRPVRVLPIPGH